MRTIALITASLALAGCAGSICWNDDSGLAPPPKESGIPNPHALADMPSVTLQTLKRPAGAPASAYRVPYIPPSR